MTVDDTIGAPADAATGGRRPIRRALLSVSDKTGLVELATALDTAGVALVSTGGSARAIADAGLPVTPVDQVTGFPECLDGRVKTLHPSIHGGLLADTRLPSHVRQLAELGIEPFDLVVVNLYPFRETVAAGASVDECVEQIDIGGPAMIRASAKNHPSVAVVVDPTSYPAIEKALAAGGFTLAERTALAAAAFAHTAAYDVAVASYLNGVAGPDDGWPEWTGATWDKVSELRYGENPHQRAALYRHWRPGLASAEQLHGKEMSYNNYARQPVWHRRGRRWRRRRCGVGARAGACLRPGLGVRRGHRGQSAGDGGAGIAGRRGLYRSAAGARLLAGGAGYSYPQEEHPVARHAGRCGARPGGIPGHLRRTADAATRSSRCAG